MPAPIISNSEKSLLIFKIDGAGSVFDPPSTTYKYLLSSSKYSSSGLLKL